MRNLRNVVIAAAVLALMASGCSAGDEAGPEVAGVSETNPQSGESSESEDSNATEPSEGGGEEASESQAATSGSVPDLPQYLDALGEPLNPLEVESVAEASGVSLVDAALHLSLADWVAEIIQIAEENHSATWAGAWFSESLTSVTVAFTEAPNDTLASILEGLSGFPHATRIEATNAERTTEDLRAIANDIMQSGGLDLASDLTVSSVAVDPERNGILVGLVDVSPTNTAQFLLQFPQYAPLIEFVEQGFHQLNGVPPSNLACQQVFTSCNPLRGGTVLHTSSTPESVASCTLGFNYVRNSIDYIITAGHCGDQSFYHSDAYVGNPSSSDVEVPAIGTVDGTVDALLFRPSSSWTESRWVIHGGTSLSQAYQMTKRYTGTSLATTAFICMTGAQTAILSTGGAPGTPVAATQCSPVLNGDAIVVVVDDQDNPLYAMTNVFTTAACSVGGDSGGPMYASFRGYGVLFGGSAATDACASSASYLRNITTELGGLITTR